MEGNSKVSNYSRDTPVRMDLSESSVAIQPLQNHKAPGSENLPPEIFLKDILQSEQLSNIVPENRQDLEKGNHNIGHFQSCVIFFFWTNFAA